MAQLNPYEPPRGLNDEKRKDHLQNLAPVSKPRLAVILFWCLIPLGQILVVIGSYGMLVGTNETNGDDTRLLEIGFGLVGGAIGIFSLIFGLSKAFQLIRLRIGSGSDSMT